MGTTLCTMQSPPTQVKMKVHQEPVLLAPENCRTYTTNSKACQLYSPNTSTLSRSCRRSDRAGGLLRVAIMLVQQRYRSVCSISGAGRDVPQRVDQREANLQGVSIQALLRKREQSAAHVCHSIGHRPPDCGLPLVVQPHLRKVSAQGRTKLGHVPCWCSQFISHQGPILGSRIEADLAPPCRQGASVEPHPLASTLRL